MDPRLPLAQNSPYSNMVCFGAAHPDPLHLLGWAHLLVYMGEVWKDPALPRVPPSWDSPAFPITNYQVVLFFFFLKVYSFILEREGERELCSAQSQCRAQSHDPEIRT